VEGVSVVEQIASVRTPEELYALVDPDVTWYSADVDSNLTCNDREDVIACIERNISYGLTGRFEVLGARDDFIVVQAVVDPPSEVPFCLLLRVRDGAIVEMRDFPSAAAALAYSGIDPSEARL
jgi:hypothetical protein